MATAAPASTRPASLALALAAFLFGSTFLVVQEAVSRTEVAPFLAARFAIAVVVLAPFARGRRPAPGLVRAGVLAGLSLLVAYVLQTWGLQHTTASASAFITYLLVVFVPLLSAVALRRPPTAATAAGVVLAVAGLALLTGAGVGFGLGEALTLGCAVAFAVHIVLLADFAPRYDTVQLNLVQMAVVAGALAGPGLVMGGYSFPAAVWWAALYTGVAVTAGAFMLQVWAQQRLGPTRTALILLLEPVFAAGLGWAAGERLGAAGSAGAGLIFTGILVSELGGRRRAGHRRPRRPRRPRRARR